MSALSYEPTPTGRPSRHGWSGIESAAVSRPLTGQAEAGAVESRWRTVSHTRTVLAVAHNLTAATRLFDALDLFAGDTRIQIVFTCPGSSVFRLGLGPFLAERGALEIPWAEAVRRRFDLAIAASCGGDLHLLDAPLVIIPHGMGYNKRLPKMSDVGCRMSDVGGRAGGWG